MKKIKVNVKRVYTYSYEKEITDREYEDLCYEDPDEIETELTCDGFNQLDDIIHSDDAAYYYEGDYCIEGPDGVIVGWDV